MTFHIVQTENIAHIIPKTWHWTHEASGHGNVPRVQNFHAVQRTVAGILQV